MKKLAIILSALCAVSAVLAGCGEAPPMKDPTGMKPKNNLPIGQGSVLVQSKP